LPALGDFLRRPQRSFLRNRPKCVALSIVAKMLVDYLLSLGLTSLVKSLGEALKKS
jgi:hypothetical protein